MSDLPPSVEELQTMFDAEHPASAYEEIDWTAISALRKEILADPVQREKWRAALDRIVQAVHETDSM